MLNLFWFDWSVASAETFFFALHLIIVIRENRYRFYKVIVNARTPRFLLLLIVSSSVFFSVEKHLSRELQLFWIGTVVGTVVYLLVLLW